MTQLQLDCAVARVTGETVGRVKSMGFSEIVVPNQIPLRLTQLYRRARLARKGQSNARPAMTPAVAG